MGRWGLSRFVFSFVVLLSGTADAQDLPTATKAGLGTAAVTAGAILVSGSKSNAEVISTTSQAPNIGDTSGASTAQTNGNSPGASNGSTSGNNTGATAGQTSTGPGLLSQGGVAGLSGATGVNNMASTVAAGGLEVGNDGAGVFTQFSGASPLTGFLAVVGTGIGTIATGPFTISTSGTSP